MIKKFMDIEIVNQFLLFLLIPGAILAGPFVREHHDPENPMRVIWFAVVLAAIFWAVMLTIFVTFIWLFARA